MRGFEGYPVPIERPSPVMAIIMHQFGQDGFVTLHDVMETGEGIPVIGAGRVGDGTDVAAGAVVPLGARIRPHSQVAAEGGSS